MVQLSARHAERHRAALVARRFGRVVHPVRTNIVAFRIRLPNRRSVPGNARGSRIEAVLAGCPIHDRSFIAVIGGIARTPTRPDRCNLEISNRHFAYNYPPLAHNGFIVSFTTCACRSKIAG